MLKRIGAVVLVLTCAGLLNGCAYVTRASETQQGVSPPGESQNPDLSFDGRYVAFDTDAPLDPADPDDSVTDVFVRDNQTATVVRVSTGDGDAGNGPSRNPSISDNGRFVAFESDASNLVPLDTNSATDVFWHDRDADADGIYDEPGAVAMVAASADRVHVRQRREHEPLDHRGRHDNRVPVVRVELRGLSGGYEWCLGHLRGELRC